MRRCDFKNSITNSSKPAGSSMQQACPVLGKILWTAPEINDAVFLPAASELSYSPLMTKVGTFIDPSREVMSVPPRARKIWPMDSPLSQGSLSTKALRRYVPSFVSDRKSTRLNSSHLGISYAVFCLKKK